MLNNQQQNIFDTLERLSVLEKNKKMKDKKEQIRIKLRQLYQSQIVKEQGLKKRMKL